MEKREDMAFNRNIALVSTVTRSHLPFARTMFQSMRCFYPGMRMFLVLVDEPVGDCSCGDVTVIPVRKLGIPGLDGMINRYTNTELCVSLKPHAMRHVLATGFDGVIYLDNDIYALSPFAELEEIVNAGKGIVLTPHLNRCEGRTCYKELELLKYGTFNLGFAYFSGGKESIDLLNWWSDWLEEYAMEDPTLDVFGDQKWLNLLPGFTNDLCILRHDGYNVAYWNIRHRKVEIINDRWFSNSVPLRFFHFSCIKLEEPCALKKPPQEYREEDLGDIPALLEVYRGKLLANGYERHIGLPMLLRKKPLERKDLREA